QMLGYPKHNIKAFTMPGFGTTPGTLKNAVKLIELLGVCHEVVDIKKLSLTTFDVLGHRPFKISCDNMEEFCKALEQLPPDSQDLVFENVQARLRTLILMSKAFV